MSSIEMKETKLQKFNIAFALILMILLFLAANSTFIFAQNKLLTTAFHEVGLNDPSVAGLSHSTITGFKIYQTSANIVKFDIPTASFIKIGIYDSHDNLVRTYIYNNLKAGSYEINLASGNLGKGVYTCVMSTGKEEQQESSKIVID